MLVVVEGFTEPDEHLGRHLEKNLGARFIDLADVVAEMRDDSIEFRFHLTRVMTWIAYGQLRHRIATFRRRSYSSSKSSPKSRSRNVLVALSFLAVMLSSVATAATHVSETGSTLLYPLMSVWIAKYMQSHPELELGAQATGSSAGVAEALSGQAQIGGSDVYLTDEQMRTGLLNVPLAVSSQEIDFNVPELHGGAPLRLSGPTLAGIYDGSIDRIRGPE